MTYGATYPQFALERRPLSRDILSVTGLGFVSLAFIGFAGACLIYAQPRSSVRVGPQSAAVTAVAPAPAPSIASAPRTVTRSSRIKLLDLTFPLDFEPLSLAESGPRRPTFVAPAHTVRVAAIAPEKVVLAPIPVATQLGETIPLPARRPIELSRP